MELKVIKAAKDLMERSDSRLFNFDMTGHDVNDDIGLCGGTLKVLVEPFTRSMQQFYQDLLGQMSDNRKLMVKLSLDTGQTVRVERELIPSRQTIVDNDVDLQDKLQGIFENQKTSAFKYKNQHYLLWQPFTPPVIHIFGAGHVGQSVATLAHFNDLPVTIYDDREKLMTSARFPHAQRVSLEFPINWKDVPKIPEQDFVLIASREHKHDHELLMGILKHPPVYVGLVSSARKWRILSQSLLGEGTPGEAIARVHAPVGLNIQAQTVPEIAISIMSEIVGFYRGADL